MRPLENGESAVEIAFQFQQDSLPMSHTTAFLIISRNIIKTTRIY